MLEGIVATIPITELTIAEARDEVEDDSYWDDTRELVLFHFSQIRLDEYENLTVGEHRRLVDFIEARYAVT